MPVFTIREIVSGLKNAQGVEAITKYLYNEHYRPVRNMVRKYGGSEEDSQDIFQDVLIIFIEIVSKDAFDPEGRASLMTYLYGIAAKLWSKRRRRDDIKKNWEQEFSDVYYHIEDVVRQYEDHLTANQLLSQIGEPCRTVLEAFYLQGQPLEEIARQLQISETSAKQRKFRCLQKLRELL